MLSRTLTMSAGALRLTSSAMRLLADVADHTAALLRPQQAPRTDQQDRGTAEHGNEDNRGSASSPAPAAPVAPTTPVPSVTPDSTASRKEAARRSAAADPLEPPNPPADPAFASKAPPTPEAPASGGPAAAPPARPSAAASSPSATATGPDLDALATAPAREVIAAVEDLSSTDLSALFELESAGRNRKTVLRAIERALAPPSEAAPSSVVYTTQTR